MDFLVKKIEEFDISRYHMRGLYRKLDSPKNDPSDDFADNTRAAERGCDSLTDCLKVQSKTIETTPSRLNPSISDLLSRPSTTSPGHDQHPASRPSDPHLHYDAMVHSYSLNPATPTPVGSNSSTGANPHPRPPQTMYCHHTSDSQRSLCSKVDPLFIRKVTAAELVCGERKYKCSGCLRYYDHLGTLLGHIDRGWREGFSCKVFYRKLKSMQDHMVMMSCQSRESLAMDNDLKLSSSSTTCLGSASLALALQPTDSDMRKGSETRDKKADMIQKWLQKTEVTASLH